MIYITAFFVGVAFSIAAAQPPKVNPEERFIAECVEQKDDVIPELVEIWPDIAGVWDRGCKMGEDGPSALEGAQKEVVSALECAKDYKIEFLPVLGITEEQWLDGCANDPEIRQELDARVSDNHKKLESYRIFLEESPERRKELAKSLKVANRVKNPWKDPALKDIAPRQTPEGAALDGDVEPADKTGAKRPYDYSDIKKKELSPIRAVPAPGKKTSQKQQLQKKINEIRAEAISNLKSAGQPVYEAAIVYEAWRIATERYMLAPDIFEKQLFQQVKDHFWQKMLIYMA